MTALHAAEQTDGHGLVRRTRFSPYQYYFDIACWAVAIIAAYLIYYNFSLTPSQVVLVIVLTLVASTAQLFFGWLAFLYRRRFGAGSFDEIRALMKTAFATGLTMVIADLIAGYSIDHPVTMSLLIIPTALAMMFGTRYVQRLRQLARAVPDRKATRTLVIGAGEVGTNLIRQMVTTPGAKYWPVGMLDDAPEKSHVQVYHVKVLGTVRELPELIVQAGAKAVVVAVAEPSKPMLREIQAIADEYDVNVKVIPPLHELLERGIHPTDLRDISTDDLLGREPVDTNVEDIAGYLAGARVLVTGAGGSIGSVLCEQISRFHPAELIMVDRCETGLQTAQLMVNGNGLLSTKETVLADIRDSDAVRELFEEHRPQVVFHAAALKHLPMLERYPEEGWKTNVVGTLNVLEAAAAVGVERFVNISTDKAANPTSVLGYTKRAAEHLTSWMGQQTDGRYLSVRFGNVIGSRGSMLPTFTRLIEQGGPLTITHPEVTRYFMTIPEACQLVLQAGGIGSPGEVMILDMGQPVKILNIAKRMIAMSGKDIEIVYTGLRDGEKLHEDLTSDSEDVRPSAHPKISCTAVEPLSISELTYVHASTKVQS
ncbi:nucleoside-diphosphate sugar epimerase/dehydratase [Enteractinococcus fodinae]|uniref:dTDP-glucose 4,6-dehydratase n=1 Tax=Enteractinococcus fodinae TaxID=684663 RepID=A0ABU2AXI0_9MICC|nr:nucleoside-diphosphate sugar epimerase/dehydratase [Enteractinococcus fodinae]MDR7346056.1 dTDP-glucose 4,6-dehydratase [Enteractinococcus fodinae]